MKTAGHRPLRYEIELKLLKALFLVISKKCIRALTVSNAVSPGCREDV